MDISRNPCEPPLSNGWKKPLPEHLPRPTYCAADAGSGDDTLAAGPRDINGNHGRWARARRGRVDWMDRRNLYMSEPEQVSPERRRLLASSLRHRSRLQ